MVEFGTNYTDWAAWAQSATQQNSVTLYGKGVNVLAEYWSRDTDTVTSDTVSLNAALGSATPDTPQGRLTASLAKLLQGASHVDAATGTREINQGIGDTLASQVAQLLTGSGFSQADANQAAASLLSQFQQATSGSGSIAVSVSGHGQNSGAYKTSVAGGTEVSAFNLQSTSTLSIGIDPKSGALSVTLDQHQLGATQIGWYTDGPPTDVSISLTQAELQGVPLDAGTSSSHSTDSPVNETQVVTGNGLETQVGWDDPTVETGAAALGQALAEEDVPLDTNPADYPSNSVDGTPDAQASAAALLPVEAALLNQLNGSSAPPPAPAPISPVIVQPGTPAATPAPASQPLSPKIADAQAALKNVTNALKQIRSFNADTKPVKVKITQPVGVGGVAPGKTTQINYTRPAGQAGTFDLPGVSLNS